MAGEDFTGSMVEFFRRLSLSGLCPNTEIERWRVQAEERGWDGRRVAQELVKSGKLTHWQARHLLAGRTAFYLGKYRLLEPIGSGGMGTVMKAEQTTLGRVVALKMLSQETLRDQDAVARFRREMQIAAALDHPNVVLAYDADEVGGMHFLVMEYVEGASLDDLIKKHGRFPLDVACECVRQAARGLEHAHGRGMVHRDVKPSNLVVTLSTTEADDKRTVANSSVVKVLDLGLARLTSGIGAGGHLTKTGEVMGTVDFMAPEQASDTHSADERSDIYSLGATLFYLLTGRAVFDKGSLVQRLMARQNQPAPPLRNFRAEAPVELEAVLAKMLDRDPARRFQTAAEVAEALEPYCGLSAWEGGVLDQQAVAELAPGEHIPPSDNLHATKTLAQSRLAELLKAAVPPATCGETIEPRSDESEDTVVQQFLGVLAHEAQTEKPTLAVFQERSSVRRRGQLRAALFIAAVVLPLTWGWWYLSTNEGRLVVEFPVEIPKNARLYVDGREQNWDRLATGPKDDDAVGEKRLIDLRVGSHEILVIWPGNEDLKQLIEVARGETVTLRVAEKIRPTPATIRRQRLEALVKRVEEWRKANLGGSADDSDLLELQREVVQYRRESADSPEDRITVAQLIRRLPWPVDRLRREDIDPDELKLFGRGDPADVPQELVAVLGSGRLKNWGQSAGMAFSPDGAMLASQGQDGAILLWDTRTADVRKTLGSGSYGYSIAFAPGGRTIAAYQNGVVLWDVEAGEVRLRINTFAKATSPVYHLGFSPDGQRLAVPIGRFGTVLYDPATGDELGSFADEYFKDFSLDGERMVLDAGNGLLRIRDVKSEKVLLEWKATIGPAVFGPNARFLATLQHGKGVTIWDAATGKLLRTLPADVRRSLRNLAFHPTKPLVAAAGEATIWLWNAETGERLHQMDLKRTEFRQLMFSPDGKTLAAASSANAITFWDVGTGTQRFTTPSGHAGLVASVAVSPDGQQIASAGSWNDPTVKLWDAATGQEMVANGELTGNFCVDFSPDGTKLAFCRGGEAVVWELATKQQLHRLSGHTDEVLSIAFSPDGKTLAGGSNWGDMSVKVWDVGTGKEIHTFTGHEGPVESVAFSSNGRWLASGSLKTMVLETGKSRRDFMLPGHIGRVTSVAFSPTRSWLVSGGAEEPTIKLWDLVTRGEILRLPGHTGGVTSVVVSPDGEQIASSGRDGTVRLWTQEVKPIAESTRTQLSGKLSKTFRLAPAGGVINEVKFTPDGRHLVTANGNGTVCVLRLANP